MRPEELGAWQALLQEEFEKPYWRTLAERVDAAYAASTVYPPREELFAAFAVDGMELPVLPEGEQPSGSEATPSEAPTPGAEAPSETPVLPTATPDPVLHKI